MCLKDDGVTPPVLTGPLQTGSRSRRSAGVDTFYFFRVRMLRLIRVSPVLKCDSYYLVLTGNGGVLFPRGPVTQVRLGVIRSSDPSTYPRPHPVFPL